MSFLPDPADHSILRDDEHYLHKYRDKPIRTRSKNTDNVTAGW